MPGVTGSVLGLVDHMSVHHNSKIVALQVLSVWQHVTWSQQSPPWDTLCLLQATKQHRNKTVQCDIALINIGVKGTTSQVVGSPAVLDRTVIVLNWTIIVLNRTVWTVIILDHTVIVLDWTVITIYGGHSFPPAWQWVRPYLVTSPCETLQCTGPPNSLLFQWWQICL